MSVAEQQATLTAEQQATLTDLMQALYHTRNAEAAAKRARERAQRELTEFMASEMGGETTVYSPEYHITATRYTVQTRSVVDEREFYAALAEVGTVPTYRQEIDPRWLKSLIEAYGGEFAGVEVREDERMRVTGDKR